MGLEDELSSDDMVFHYTKMSKAVEGILHTGKLRLSKRSSTNDPFEWPFSYIPMGAVWPDRQRVSSAVEKARIANDIVLKAINERTYFLSFCKNRQIQLPATPHADQRENYGFLKPRMWAQYADSSRGVCLAFSTDKIFKAAIVQWSGLKLYSGSVDYINFREFETIELHMDMTQLLILEPSPYADRYIDAFHERIFFRKHLDYRDEDEYRIAVCSLFDSEPTESIEIKDCLKAIIVSSPRAEPYMKLLCELSKEYDAKLVEIAWENQKIEIAEVNCTRSKENI
jgi:hypothetical protein